MNHVWSPGLVAEAEIAATLTGVISVWLLSRGDGRGWPLGTVMVLLSGWVYWHDRIYGSTALNAVFLVLQLIGWARWAKGTEPDLRQTSRVMTWPQRVATLALWGMVVFPIAWLLATQGGRYVWLDAVVTAGSLVAQALVVYGLADAWLVYLAVDIAYVGLSYQVDRYFYAGMYLVFCVLAVQGWVEWSRNTRDRWARDRSASLSS